jgi:hypothetical protein
MRLRLSRELDKLITYIMCCYKTLVISFSSINNKGWIKFSKYVQDSERDYIFNDVTLFAAVHSQVTGYSSILFSVSLYSHSTTLLDNHWLWYILPGITHELLNINTIHWCCWNVATDESRVKTSKHETIHACFTRICSKRKLHINQFEQYKQRYE